MQTARHTQILAYLEDHDYLGLGEAVQWLQASRSTVWRDFLTLASQNLVERTRGGIRKCEGRLAPVFPFDQRQVNFAREKDAIARRAAQLLRERDVLIADGGTTICHLATYMPDFPLTVVTTSIPLILALSKRKRELPALEMVVIGGVYHPDLGISLGASTQESLSRMHAQWAFLGVDGVAEDGVSNNNYLSIQSKIQVIRNSEKVGVLADHSKIGRRAMTRVCGLDEIDLLITDEYDDNAPILNEIRAQGVEVVIVSQTEPAVG